MKIAGHNALWCNLTSTRPLQHSCLSSNLRQHGSSLFSVHNAPDTEWYVERGTYEMGTNLEERTHIE